MDTPHRTAAALKLDGYVRHYRGMAAVRFAMAFGLSAIVGIVAGVPYAIGFGLLHFALYGVLFWAVEVAARDPASEQALRKLTIRTGLITFLISLQACAMALEVRETATTTVVRLETGLLIIGVLMFTALQVHMSRLGYAAAIAPSIVSLIWIGSNGSAGAVGMASGHFAIAICLFVAAVVAASWRQQATDRTLANVRLTLEEKNAALTALVAEAEAARAQAEAASRAKSDFLAMTSHEIRTPLNAVLGLAEALNRSRLSARQKDMARGVVDAGALLKRLLDSMLDIGRIEAGKTTLNIAPFDLRQAVETVVRVWTPRAGDHGVTLVADLDALPTPCGLLADGGKVEQVLINLVSNALKFSPLGGRVVIGVSATAAPGGTGLAVRMEVVDQGPGVTVEDRERIFQVFEQTDAGRALGGAGLGLAICAGNLALMGGGIEVVDAPGGGAVFRASFAAPACVLSGDAADAAEAEGLDAERPLRVLAAEDNAGNRHVLRALLEPLAISLTLVEDGAQALEALAAGPFDMVLMDANMPVMDGLTALRAIRSSGSSIPVWMLTANVYEEDVNRYRAAGADGVVRKPIALEELFAALSDAAARIEAPAEAEAA
jgi:signal transduction histidine kinase/ActR/RegA family two-component response regulator